MVDGVGPDLFLESCRSHFGPSFFRTIHSPHNLWWTDSRCFWRQEIHLLSFGWWCPS
jgi:hypothetical protein